MGFTPWGVELLNFAAYGLRASAEKKHSRRSKDQFPSIRQRKRAMFVECTRWTSPSWKRFSRYHFLSIKLGGEVLLSIRKTLATQGFVILHTLRLVFTKPLNQIIRLRLLSMSYPLLDEQFQAEIKTNLYTDLTTMIYPLTETIFSYYICIRNTLRQARSKQMRLQQLSGQFSCSIF